MGKLLKYITILAIAWCIPGFVTGGEQVAGPGYWVIGSFRNLEMATREADRVTAQTGIKTSYMENAVNGVNYYRVLVPHSGEPDDQARLIGQLADVGIHDPWPVRIDDSPISTLSAMKAATVPMEAEPVTEMPARVEVQAETAADAETKASAAAIAAVAADAETKASAAAADARAAANASADVAAKADTDAKAAASEPVASPEDFYFSESSWLVLGSFSDYGAAQELVEEVLGALGFIPEMRDFVVGTKSILRVMAGPYLDSRELDDARRQLQAAGYTEAWLYKDDSTALGEWSTDYSRMPLDPMPNYTDQSQSASAQQHQQRTELMRQTRDSIKQPENTIRPGFNLATLRKKED